MASFGSNTGYTPTDEGSKSSTSEDIMDQVLTMMRSFELNFSRKLNQIHDDVQKMMVLLKNNEVFGRSTTGRLKYSKDFFYALAKLPQCTIAPNLPLSVRARIEKSRDSGDGFNMLRCRKVEELYPCIKGNFSLRKAHNGNIEFYENVQTLLNDFTLDKVDIVADQIKELSIKDLDHLFDVVDLIVCMAIDVPDSNEALARLCKTLSNEYRNQLNFKRALSNNIKYRMDLRETFEAEHLRYKQQKTKELAEFTDKVKMMEMMLQLKKDAEEFQMKVWSFCRFLGELIKAGLSITVIPKQTDEKSVECLCKLLTTVLGEQYKSKLENRVQALEPIMNELSEFIGNNNENIKTSLQIPSKSRARIQDVLNLWANHEESRHGDSSSKMSVQIQEEADTSSKKSNQSSSDGKKNGGCLNKTQQLHGSAMGILSCEGTVMRFTLPCMEPSPQASLKPVLSDEDVKKVVRSTLDEFQSFKDIKDIEDTLSKEFVTPACLGKFVDAFIEYCIEGPKNLKVAPVLGNLLGSKFSHFTPDLLTERFDDFLSMSVNSRLDCPKFFSYMAFIIGNTLTSEYFNFDHVRQSCKSILRSDNAKKVLAHIFVVANILKTPVWIKNKWNSSNVKLNDFIADDDIDEFIKTNKLEYLNDPNTPVLESSSSMLKFDETKTKLLQILQDHPDDTLVPVQNWVNQHWGPGPYDKTLIRPLMTAVCEVSIKGLDEKNQFNGEVFKKYSKLIRFFVDDRRNLEAHCLMAVCLLVEKLQYPKDLALHIFQNLVIHTVSLEGIKWFYNGVDEIDLLENREERLIKEKVILETQNFWLGICL